MKKFRKWLIAFVVLIIVGIIVDQVTAVRPAYPVRDGYPILRRPQAEDDPFLRAPIAPTYEERKAAYLEWLLTKPTPDERGGVWADIAKLSVDPTIKVNEKALQDALDYVSAPLH